MESRLVWNDRYSVGVNIIDKEHKKLFRILNKLFEFGELETKRPWVCQETVKYFKDHAVRHFKDEEDYMERIHYEGLPAQRRAHGSFIERIEGIDLNTVDGDPKLYLQSLIEFLLGWLINHILYTDKKIPKE